jgi:hypothetical protein
MTKTDVQIAAELCAREIAEAWRKHDEALAAKQKVVDHQSDGEASAAVSEADGPQS